MFKCIVVLCKCILFHQDQLSIWQLGDLLFCVHLSGGWGSGQPHWWLHDHRLLSDTERDWPVRHCRGQRQHWPGIYDLFFGVLKTHWNIQFKIWTAFNMFVCYCLCFFLYNQLLLLFTTANTFFSPCQCLGFWHSNSHLSWILPE